MENSKIQWTTHTMNPVHGCTRVSEGCRLCYAEKASHRNPGVLGVWGPQGTRVVASEAKWREPLKWNREYDAAIVDWRIRGGESNAPRPDRPRVFCASISDVFEDWPGPMVNAQGNRIRGNRWWPDLRHPPTQLLSYRDVRVRLGDLIRRTPNLDWLLLTKRTGNVLAMMADGMFGVDSALCPMIPPNVWIGGTVENQRRADERGPQLVQIRAAGARVVFMSCEPLLEGIDVRPWLGALSGVNWVICGGESGAMSNVTAFDPHWGQMLRDQCDEATVAFFMKQLGSAPVQLTVKGKGGEMDEFPDYLRVRDFPSA